VNFLSINADEPTDPRPAKSSLKKKKRGKKEKKPFPMLCIPTKSNY